MHCRYQDWSGKDLDTNQVIANQTGVYGFHHGIMSYAFKEDGTAFVQVPWKNTEYTASTGVKMVGTDIQHDTVGDANKSLDMYAFGTDAYGHVVTAVATKLLNEILRLEGGKDA